MALCEPLFSSATCRAPDQEELNCGFHSDTRYPMLRLSRVGFIMKVTHVMAGNPKTDKNPQTDT